MRRHRLRLGAGRRPGAANAMSIPTQRREATAYGRATRPSGRDRANAGRDASRGDPRRRRAGRQALPLAPIRRRQPRRGAQRPGSTRQAGETVARPDAPTLNASSATNGAGPRDVWTEAGMPTPPVTITGCSRAQATAWIEHVCHPRGGGSEALGGLDRALYGDANGLCRAESYGLPLAEPERRQLGDDEDTGGQPQQRRRGKHERSELSRWTVEAAGRQSVPARACAARSRWVNSARAWTSRTVSPTSGLCTFTTQPLRTHAVGRRLRRTPESVGTATGRLDRAARAGEGSARRSGRGRVRHRPDRRHPRWPCPPPPPDSRQRDGAEAGDGCGHLGGRRPAGVGLAVVRGATCRQERSTRRAGGAAFAGMANVLHACDPPRASLGMTARGRPAAGWPIRCRGRNRAVRVWRSGGRPRSSPMPGCTWQT